MGRRIFKFALSLDGGKNVIIIREEGRGGKWRSKQRQPRISFLLPEMEDYDNPMTKIISPMLQKLSERQNFSSNF